MMMLKCKHCDGTGGRKIKIEKDKDDCRVVECIFCHGSGWEEF